MLSNIMIDKQHNILCLNTNNLIIFFNHNIIILIVNIISFSSLSLTDNTRVITI
jgi:hypothetical protein